MRSRCDSTFASLHMSRCVTSDFDISSVKSATGHLVADGEVRGDAEAERRLPHARARGDDDQVARLEAATVIRSMSRKPDGTPVTSAPDS